MNKSLAKGIYYLAQRVRKEGTADKLGELNKMQWLSLSQIKQQQQERLDAIIQYAAENVPFYRKRFERVSTLEDFGKIPVLTREEVRSNIGSLLSEKCSKKSLFEYHSSGSTGEPLTLYFSPAAMGYFHAAQYRGFSWYGLEPADRSVKLWGFPLKFITRCKEGLSDIVMNRKRISAFDMSEESMERYYGECKKFRPVFLYGYASALYRFGQYLKESNTDGCSLKLRAVISTSEVLYKHQRELLGEVFGCSVVNEYGAAEVGIIGFECPDGRIHITAENVYLEVLRQGKPVKEGEVGEVVVTGLRNLAMPLIRYRIGDLAVLSSSSCPCGRGLQVLESLQGRDNDMIKTPEGKAVHSEVFAYINRDLIKNGFLVREFKIIQNAKNRLRVLVSRETEESALVALEKQIRKYVGPCMQIAIEQVERVPAEKSGKIRYVTSELD